MRVLALTLAVALSGCALSQHQQARTHMERGETWSAITILQVEVQRGNIRAWNDLGVAYERVGEHEKSIQHFIMAARWGDPTAQQNLINKGYSVPAPDLANAQANRSAADAANAAATMNLIQALQPKPLPMPQIPRQVNCSSYRIGNTVQTQCN